MGGFKNLGILGKIPMKINSDHWLESSIRKPLIGGNDMPTRRALVLHFTSGASALSSIEFWKSPEAMGACAHFVIDRDGTIYQCRPFDRTAGHAGKSIWTDPNTGTKYQTPNAVTIGIEFANAGDSATAEGKAFGGKFTCPAGSDLARHKNGGPLTHWERFPKKQIDAGKLLAAALVLRYNLDDIVGHDDIAPGRKNDPGPLFPMFEFKNLLNK